MTNNRIAVDSLDLESVFGKKPKPAAQKIRETAARFEDQQFTARHLTVAVAQRHPELLKMHGADELLARCRYTLRDMHQRMKTVERLGGGWWANRCQQ